MNAPAAAVPQIDWAAVMARAQLTRQRLRELAAGSIEACKGDLLQASQELRDAAGIYLRRKGPKQIELVDMRLGVVVGVLP